MRTTLEKETDHNEELNAIELELSSMPCDENGNAVDRERAAQLIAREEQLTSEIYA